MQFLLIPAAAYLALYAPGHYLLRGRRGEHAADGSHLLREILLSACCTSWVGFVLAELGIYSLLSLLTCLALAAAGAALLTRRSHPAAYGARDLAGLALLILSCLWVAPPLDTRLMGSDSAEYVAAGIHLSRHGSLIIHDPTLPLLSPDLKRSLFRSTTMNPGSPPYLRLAGALLLRSLDTDEVLPAFHHLITVWIAAFDGLAGPSAATWVITLFAGLSVWAMVEFATTVSGGWAGFLFLVLLSFSPAQNLYSRFLMPEVPGQFFVWGGLCCLQLWSRTHRRADAVIAGLAFGVAGLMRLENALFVAAALLAALWLRRNDCGPHSLVLVGCAAVIWAHTAAHLLLFRTHYAGNLLSLWPETLALLTNASAKQIAVLIAVCTATFLIWVRRAARPAASNGLLLVAVLAACIACWGDWRIGWTSLHLLSSYLGVPTLVAGGIGLGLWTKRDAGNGVTAWVFVLLVAAVFVQVMWAPHAAPIPIWTVRRAVTVVLPAFCLGAAWLCCSVARRWHRAAAILVCAAALVGQAVPFQKLWQGHYYAGSLRHVQAISALLPPRACLIFDSDLAGWGFDTALWAERDLPAYLLSRFDTKHISKLVQTFHEMPVFWISDGYTPPPRLQGITITPIALYQFALSTPPPDIGASPAVPVKWNATVGVYLMAVSKQGASDTG
jgi:hypothetical protein